MLLIFEKRIRGGICHAICRYAKANNKYMKNYNKNSESSYLIYLDPNNLYGWAMYQRLPVDGFEWMEQFSCFYLVFIVIYHIYLKEKLKNSRSLFVTYITKKTMSRT